MEAEGEYAGLLRMGIEVTARMANLGVPMDMEISIVQWVDSAGQPGGRHRRRRADKIIVFSETTATVTRHSTMASFISPWFRRLPSWGTPFLALPPDPPASPSSPLTDRVQYAQTTLTALEDWTVSATSRRACSLSLDREWLVRGTGAFGIVFDFTSEEEARDLGRRSAPVDSGLGVPVEPASRPRTVSALGVTFAAWTWRRYARIEGRQR